MTCLEAPNLKVRVERGFCATAVAARKYPDRTIFLDGAAQGEPFMDPQRQIYNLDHHEGCVRAFTLSTCEQALIMILKGLDLRSGDWTIYANEPDLDTVLAIWLLLNYMHVPDPEIRRQVVPLTRLQGVIDAHGLELTSICGFAEEQQQALMETINSLRREEVQLKQSGKWSTVNFYGFTGTVLHRIDGMLYSEQHYDGLQAVTEISREPIGPNRVAIVCRADTGVYEVEQYLRKVYGDRVGVLILQKDARTYTLRLMDAFMPLNLQPVYERLNQLEPNATGDSKWGGSDDIGGSPRGLGTALADKEIGRICSSVFQPPNGRLRPVLSQMGLFVLVVCAALAIGFRGFPSGSFWGLISGAPLKVGFFFSAALTLVTLVFTLAFIRQSHAAYFGLRLPRGSWSWALLAPLLLAPLGVGGVAAMPGLTPANAGADAWMLFVVQFLGAAGVELLCRGLVQGALVPHFKVGRHGGRWLVSWPTVLAALLSTVLLTAFYRSAHWLGGLGTLVQLALVASVALIAGLASGVIRERSGSILPSIGLHAITAYGFWLISLS